MGLNKTSDNALFIVETENLKIIPKVTCSPAVKGSLNSLDFFVYISPYPNSGHVFTLLCSRPSVSSTLENID